MPTSRRLPPFPQRTSTQLGADSKPRASVRAARRRARRPAAAARARGYYTRQELIRVCAWKTPRSHGRVTVNSRHAVVSRTRRALAGSDESERIQPLLELHGVGVPTAATLLYFAFPHDYPILDVRALESLGAK